MGTLAKAAGQASWVSLRLKGAQSDDDAINLPWIVSKIASHGERVPTVSTGCVPPRSRYWKAGCRALETQQILG